MNNSTTAAQPLDLDKQRALFEAGELDSSSNLKRQADGQYEDPCTQSAWEGWQNALIAKARAAQPDTTASASERCRACFGVGIDTDPPEPGRDDTCRKCNGTGRAAQPESATGTTGASVDTLEFRRLVMAVRHAAWNFDGSTPEMDALIAHIDAIIGDLRAQLAAKGQGMPSGYTVKHVEGHGWVIDAPKSGRWVAFDGTPAGELLADLSAPASAQPTDLERDYQADYQYLLGLRAGWNLSQQRDVEGFNAALAARQACLDDAKRDLKGSAQPDRGAAIAKGAHHGRS